MEFTKIKCRSNTNHIIIIHSSNKYIFFHSVWGRAHVAYCNLGDRVTVSKHVYLVFTHTKEPFWRAFRDTWISAFTNRHSHKMWNIKAKDFKTKWTREDLWFSARQPNLWILALGWMVSPGTFDRLDPALAYSWLGGISSWKPQLVFAAWALNNVQAGDNTSHGRSQEISRRLATVQGKGPKYLSRPIPHGEMTAGLRTAGMTWGDNDINYIVKMGRRHKENGFYLPI